MKTFLMWTVIALGVVAAPAGAADLGARVQDSAPADTVAAYRWSGFYLGVNGGYGWNKDSWSAIPGGADFGSHVAGGAIGGGQIGYRLQTGAWVVGLEAAGDWADLSGSHLDKLGAPFVDQSRLKSIGLFTAQAGYAWDNALLYAKGGAAVTRTRWVSAAGTTYSDERSRWGVVLGAGLEYGFAPNWSAGLEYDHLFVARRNETLTYDPCCTPFLSRVGGDTDLVMARINYRFGDLALAKY
ncbi:MAG: outer membrane beta-barrel protein [Ancalomicrobiaceae bacterium]|nr:outer membrane beta-barrel protein [Ancalomicrobiaceae bacterium]